MTDDLTIIEKLYNRMQEHKKTFGDTCSPDVLLLTKEELEELQATAESKEKLIFDLAQLGMHTEIIYPEEISAILEVLTVEQIAILLTHPRNRVRDLAMQEYKIRKTKQNSES